MPRVAESLRLERVVQIIASGEGLLDFLVEGEDKYYTWDGVEDADWTVENVGRVENGEEDRIHLYPAGDYFVCELNADGEEFNQGPVRCDGSES